ncbi:MAG TPA: hypothetical protein PKL08_10800, partial [Thermoanaerobaculaceae bacterium]|nr:hypothetical protein [Thermoanaerobaculaceae bacterium]
MAPASARPTAGGPRASCSPLLAALLASLCRRLARHLDGGRTARRGARLPIPARTLSAAAPGPGVAGGLRLHWLTGLLGDGGAACSGSSLPIPARTLPTPSAVPGVALGVRLLHLGRRVHPRRLLQSCRLTGWIRRLGLSSELLGGP